MTNFPPTSLQKIIEIWGIKVEVGLHVPIVKYSMYSLSSDLIFFLSLFFQVFRDHNIDGSALPLLTEDHLTLRLGLKLGPALKLRSIIAKKLGPSHADICVHCAHCNSKITTTDRDETNHNNGISNSIADLNHERSASRNSNLSEK